MTPTLQVRVNAKRAETADICVLELTAPDGAALPAFAAGAHVDVFLPGLPARQYSLCNDPSETHRYVLGVLREPASRGGSRAVHDDVAQGDTLTIGAPRNHFALVPGAARSVLLAGGIGVTPILAMAETLWAEGTDFAFHYCARSLDRAAFRDRIAQAPWAGRAHMHLDDGAPDQRLDLAATLADAGPGVHLYVCGPTGFLDWVKRTAAASGWDDANVHAEYFAGAPVETQAGDHAFDVEIAETGQVVHVPADQTVLHALLAAGLDIPNSCEEGVCGMCQTRVLDGTPDHRDNFLTKAERAANDCFMPCCSRITGDRVVISTDY